MFRTKEEAVIRRNMTNNQMLHRSELSRAVGMNDQAMRTRFRDPGTMRLYELRSIVAELDVPYLDVLAIALGDMFDEGKARKELD